MSRPLTWLGPADVATDSPLVSLAEVTEIELLILRRMREFTIGEHPSVFHGSGYDFTGLRGWQAGDRFEAIDWAQSSLTNFSPLIVREFDQPSTSAVTIVADRSASAWCGASGLPIAAIIARAVATLGMSAVFFQDAVGLITLGDSAGDLRGMRPRIGKGQVVHCVEAYQSGQGLQPLRAAGGWAATINGFLRKTSLIPVISDFLFDDADAAVRELAALNHRHDVFLGMVDASFAFELPRTSAGWLHVRDSETGRTRVVSRREAARLADRVRAWQERVAATAHAAGLDLVRLGPDPRTFDLALIEFVAARRLRRKAS
jgi:uncharacterized protein (DUF58 family)